MPRNVGKLGFAVVVDFCTCRTADCMVLSCARRSDIPKPANMNNAQKTALQWAFILSSGKLDEFRRRDQLQGADSHITVKFLFTRQRCSIGAKGCVGRNEDYRM